MDRSHGFSRRGGRMATLLAIAALLLTSGTAAAVERFTDPAGDVTGGEGPDIVAVAVSQPDATRIAFAIEFATAPPLGFDVDKGYSDMLMLFLDTKPPRTDGMEGVDFIIGAHGANLDQGASLVALESGTSSGDIQLGVVTTAVDAKTLTLTLPLDAIGNPDLIRFGVGAGREGPGEQTGGEDSLPNKGGQVPTYTTTASGSASPDWVWPALAAVAVGAALLVLFALVMRGRRRRGSDTTRVDPAP